MDEVTLCAFIAAQVDARFLSLDLSKGSRILWPEVAAHMSRSTGRKWLETDCQRLWRQCAYGEDIGIRSELLPDSDGEDDAAQREFLPFPCVGGVGEGSESACKARASCRRNKKQAHDDRAHSLSVRKIAS